jgi:hypothetical protein
MEANRFVSVTDRYEGQRGSYAISQRTHMYSRLENIFSTFVFDCMEMVWKKLLQGKRSNVLLKYITKILFFI